MADSVLKASDNDKSVYLDPVNLVKSYLSTSILFSNALTEFSRKKKSEEHNWSKFSCTLWAKATDHISKNKNKKPLVFLLGGNLKQAAKDSRRSQEITSA